MSKCFVAACNGHKGETDPGIGFYEQAVLSHHAEALENS